MIVPQRTFARNSRFRNRAVTVGRDPRVAQTLPFVSATHSVAFQLPMPRV
jgi:hypothetical protein